VLLEPPLPLRVGQPYRLTRLLLGRGLAPPRPGGGNCTPIQLGPRTATPFFGPGGPLGVHGAFRPRSIAPLTTVPNWSGDGPTRRLEHRQPSTWSTSPSWRHSSPGGTRFPPVDECGRTYVATCGDQRVTRMWSDGATPPRTSGRASGGSFARYSAATGVAFLGPGTSRPRIARARCVRCFAIIRNFPRITGPTGGDGAGPINSRR